MNFMNEEQVNHPKHYNQYPIEVIDMMTNIWGTEKTLSFCLLNAFKYRMRIGHKDNIQQDLEKEQWYLNRAKELQLLPDNKTSIFIIEQAWMDPTENNVKRAFGYDIIGFVNTENKAKEICDKSDTLTQKDCWAISNPWI
jgi:hypothetical protein